MDMSVRRAAAFGVAAALMIGGSGSTRAQNPPQNPTAQEQTPASDTVRLPPPDPKITALVARLDLEKYKETIKGLTQVGDRRAGTKRNRDAVDWIEAQLKSFGCTNTERVTYTYTTPARGGG